MLEPALFIDLRLLLNLMKFFLEGTPLLPEFLLFSMQSTKLTRSSVCTSAFSPGPDHHGSVSTQAATMVLCVSLRNLISSLLVTSIFISSYRIDLMYIDRSFVYSLIILSWDSFLLFSMISILEFSSLCYNKSTQFRPDISTASLA